MPASAAVRTVRRSRRGRAPGRAPRIEADVRRQVHELQRRRARRRRRPAGGRRSAPGPARAPSRRRCRRVACVWAMRPVCLAGLRLGSQSVRTWAASSAGRVADLVDGAAPSSRRRRTARPAGRPGRPSGSARGQVHSPCSASPRAAASERLRRGAQQQVQHRRLRRVGDDGDAGHVAQASAIARARSR